MLLLLPLLGQKRSHHLVYRACPLFLFLSLSLSPRCTRLVRLVTDYSLWDTMVGRLNNSRFRRAPHTLRTSNFFSLFFFFFPVLYIYIFYRYIYLLIFVLGRNTRDSFASLVREGRISHLFDTKTRHEKKHRIIPRLSASGRSFTVDHQCARATDGQCAESSRSSPF